MRPPEFAEVVLVLTEAIGDSLMALPALQALEDGAGWGEVMVVSTTEVNELLADEFPSWTFRTREGMESVSGCRLCVDFLGTPESSALVRRLGGRRIGVDVPDVDVAAYDHTVRIGPFAGQTSATELFNPVVRFLLPGVAPGTFPRFRRGSARLPGRRLALVPGAGCAAKRWPLDHFAGLIGGLRRADWEPVWFLGPKESSLLPWIQQRQEPICLRLPSAALKAELARCSLVISNDTALMHLGASLGVPTFGIFGPSSPGQWFPYPLPCRFFQHPQGGREQGVLDQPEQSYIHWPTLDEILEAALELSRPAGGTPEAHPSTRSLSGLTQA